MKLVITCDHGDCGYGYGEDVPNIEVAGIVEIPNKLDLDCVPGEVEIMQSEFKLPDDWQSNYNNTEFRCPEHRTTERGWND